MPPPLSYDLLLFFSAAAAAADVGACMLWCSIGCLSLLPTTDNNNHHLVMSLLILQDKST